MMGILEQIRLYTLLDEVHQPEGHTVKHTLRVGGLCPLRYTQGHTVKHTLRVGGLRPARYEIKIIISPYKIIEKDAMIVR